MHSICYWLEGIIAWIDNRKGIKGRIRGRDGLGILRGRTNRAISATNEAYPKMIEPTPRKWFIINNRHNTKNSI